MASDIVNVAVITGVPLIQGLVKAIKPVRGSGEINDLLARDIVGDEDGNGVADEHVTTLDITPEEIPDIRLGGASFGDQVAADLDVGPIEDRAVGGRLLDERDKARHLRVVNL